MFNAPPPDKQTQAIMEMANKVADTFIEAIPKMDDRLSFKAFTIGGDMSKEQKNAILDIVMVQITARLKEKAPELLEEKTITGATENTETEMVFWLHATSEKPLPPTKEEPYLNFDPDVETIRPAIKRITDEEKEEIDSLAAKPETLVEVSGLGHLQPELHSRT